MPYNMLSLKNNISSWVHYKHSVFIVAAIALIPLFGFALNTVTTGFQVGSTDVLIDAHGVCQNVSATDGNSYFVPTNTASEWSAFRTNKPAGVTLGACNSIIENPTHGGGLLDIDTTTAVQSCIERGYNFGLVSRFGFSYEGERPELAYYQDGAWRSHTAPGYFGYTWAQEIHCFNVSSYVDILNPVRTNVPLWADEITASRYCQDLGYVVGAVLDKVIDANNLALYGKGTWTTTQASGWSGGPWPRVLSLRCINAVSSMTYATPLASNGYRTCVNVNTSRENLYSGMAIGGFTTFHTFNNHETLCKERGFATGIITDVAGAICAGGPGQCWAHACTWTDENNEWSLGSGGWFPPYSQSITCFTP